MYRYRTCVCAVVVALALVLGGSGWGPQSSLASSFVPSPQDYGNTCGGFLEQGSNVTRLAVRKHAVLDGDTWEGAEFISRQIKPGWFGPPGYFWGSHGGFFQGCSNAVTFAAAGKRPSDQALIGVQVAFPFGAKNHAVAECHVLHVQGNAGFTCHRYKKEFGAGYLGADFTVTST
jgi:hypothetical protein